MNAKDKKRLHDEMLGRIRAATNIHVVGVSATEGTGILQLLWKLKKTWTGHDFSTGSRFKKTFSTAHYGMPTKKRDALLAKVWAERACIHFHDNYLDGVGEADLIFVSQNWRAYAANKKLLALYDSTPARFVTLTDLYFTLFPGKIVGITGTNGKSTTSRLVADIMKASRHRSFFTGNDRRNEQIIHRYDQWTEKDVLVIEVSNRQLGRSLPRGPEVGVVLNVTQNHLDEYGNDFGKYAASKFRLIEKQKRGDVAVLNADNETTRTFAKEGKGKAYTYSIEKGKRRGAWVDSGHVYYHDDTTHKVTRVDKIGLVGPHNLSNVLAAIVATRQVGVDWVTIRHVVSRFRGLPQRLERVARQGGVQYIDDSVSTTPESTAMAIDSFAKNTVHLIAGGDTKGMNYDSLGPALQRCASVTLLASPAAEALRARVGETPCHVVSTLRTAIRHAKSHAKRGDTVLLSPAAAFFIYFGDTIPGGAKAFRQIVGEL